MPASSKNKRSTKGKTTASASKKKSAAVKSNKKTAENKGLTPRIKGILYIAVAFVLLCLNLIKGEFIWSGLRSFMFGVFGFCSILLPVFFVYLTVVTTKEQQVQHLKTKITLSAAVILFISSLIFMFTTSELKMEKFFTALSKLYVNSSNSNVVFSSGGGLISGLLGYPLTVGLGTTAAIIIAFVALFVILMIITGLSMNDIANVAKKPMNAVGEGARKVKEKSDTYIHQLKKNKEVNNNGIAGVYDKKSIKGKQKYDDRIDIPIDTKNLKKSLKSNETDIALVDDGVAVTASPADDLLSVIRMANGQYDDSVNKASIVAQEISNKKKSRVVEKDAKQPNPETVPIDAKAGTKADSADNFANEVNQSKNEQQDKPQYKYPPVELLHPNYGTDDSNAMNELQNNATKLIETLKSFGVAASIVNICRGPSVTRYELQPGAGVKISKITNLADDIALNLAADGVRIEAPIPGKAAVGIEIPNKNVSMVSMRELIDSPEFTKGKSKLSCALGKDISGNNIVADLSKMPHLLIAGTTGSGKSVCVNSILLSILFKATPDEAKLLLIDPKMVEFSKYKGIPHLLVPVVSDAKKAAGALGWAVTEMLQRYKIFSEFDCKNIHGFNKLVDSNIKYILENSTDDEDVCMEINGLAVPKEKMPQIVIAIDELADLMMAAPNEVEDSICRLAQMARAAGMHLIIATQRPSVNVITGVIKANIPSRISLKVSSQIDSRTILDIGGAEKLIGHGDMLFAPVGISKPLRVQGCYASDDEIERVTGYIKKSYDTQYNIEVEEKIRRIAAEELASANKKETAATIDGNEVDSLMEDAIKCVIEAGQASTSLLQRRLKVGYARAGRMVDDMEQMGIVGPHQGSKARDVLMTYQQWLERNNIIGDNIKIDTGYMDDIDDYDE